jgi:hypothetical protein
MIRYITGPSAIYLLEVYNIPLGMHWLATIGLEDFSARRLQGGMLCPVPTCGERTVIMV